VKSFTEVLRL